MQRAFFTAALSAALLSSPAVWAQSITFAAPYVRAVATTSGHANTAGYVVLVNSGDKPDTLLSITSSIAPKIEVHDMVELPNGAMRMQKMDKLEIPAGGVVSLAPGGKHIMVMGVSQPLAEGENVPMTMTFEKAGPITVQFEVRSTDVVPGASK